MVFGKLSNVISVFAIVLCLASCGGNGKNNVSGSQENAQDLKQQKQGGFQGVEMEIILYNDDTGEVLDANEKRICGFELSGGRKGTMHIRTSQDIEFFGATTKYIYLKKGYAYAEFDDVLRDKTENGIPFQKEEKGSEIHYYLIPGGKTITSPTKEALSSASEEVEDNASSQSSSKKTWTGASSMEELRSKLDGTSWYGNYNGLMKKFKFSNGGLTMYTSLKGSWDAGYYYSSYELNMHRTNSGNFISVDFGDENEKMEHRGFSIAFANKCMVAILFQFGNHATDLKYGDYEFTDEL